MAPAVGVMERLLERTVAHARQRKAGATAIGKHQAVAHRIADMELRIEAARLLLYRAAWQRMRHGSAARESALAKLAVSEAYVEVCRSAMQIFGGYGYTVECEVERELRDALAATLVCRDLGDPAESRRRPEGIGMMSGCARGKRAG